MKKIFWLVSALGLTVAQTGVAQANTVDQAYVNTLPDIDGAINSLLSSQASNSSSIQIRQSTTVSSFSASHQPVGVVSQLAGNNAPSVAAQFASRAAHGRSIGRCALYVRRALQAAGYQFTQQPSAYMYATKGTLASAGFVKLSNDNYVPQVGDVAVFNRTSKNPHGHIQIYDGNQWVSDFRQNKFSPYRNHNGYSVWRDARFVDASANTGTYLALNEQ